MITFDVSRVEGRWPISTIGAQEAIERLLAGKGRYDGPGQRAAPKADLDAFFVRTSHLVPTPTNGFVYAAELAFSSHAPLAFGPDEVWHVLSSGLAQHIKRHAEALRGRFVDHQGKAKLVVRRDDFHPERQNPWDETIDAFVEQIREHVGKRADLFLADFSTTDPIARLVSSITAMDALQHYFDYSVVTVCGIPKITLLGTVDDWKEIRRRAATFTEYGVSGMSVHEDVLPQWVDELLPLLDELVSTAEGNPQRDFWRSFVKVDDMSGGPYLSGWITSLFPFLSARQGLVPNTHLGSWRRADEEGPKADHFPSGLSVAPFRWELPLMGQQREMEFIGGFVGVSKDDETATLRPELGWAVRHRAARQPHPAAFGTPRPKPPKRTKSPKKKKGAKRR